MAKFKVGDRVKHRSSVTGSVTDVLPSGNYYVRLDRPAFPGDDCMWPFDERELMPLTPAIPAGWTPASEPPDGIRDVLVMLKGGEKRLGWYSESAIISGGNWYLYPEGTTPKSIDDDDTSFDDTPAAPGEVLAWCEIEPAAKPAAQVRYAVRYSNTVKDKDDDGDYYLTMDEAAVEAKRLVAKYGKEIEVGHWVVDAVVKPAEPEVIRMEE